MPSLTKHLPADERRAATVKAVIELAAAQNPSEITTTAIAKHMSLTQGALFRHFSGKAAIWESVMSWVAEHLLERVENAAKKVSHPLDSLEAIFMAHIEFVAAHPGVPRMMFAELQRAEDSAAKMMVRSLIQRYTECLCVQIDSGKQLGFIAEEIDSAAAAALFIGTIQGLVMQSMLAGDPRRMPIDAPRVFSIFRRGLTNHDVEKGNHG